MIDLFSKVIIPIFGITTVLIISNREYNEKHPPMCDSCTNLHKKRSEKDRLHYRYECGYDGSFFDYPPKICDNYVPRCQNKENEK